MSSTVNPILYNLMSRKYRQAFKETLCRCVLTEEERIRLARGRYYSDRSTVLSSVGHGSSVYNPHKSSTLNRGSRASTLEKADPYHKHNYHSSSEGDSPPRVNGRRYINGVDKPSNGKVHRGQNLHIQNPEFISSDSQEMEMSQIRDGDSFTKEENIPILPRLKRTL